MPLSDPFPLKELALIIEISTTWYNVFVYSIPQLR